ncbi:MAG: hypothetical protein RL318_1439 [Fibrobacterota bacterium]|jgi:acetylornithine/N-succinyldiaminopimelate aminotransferase
METTPIDGHTDWMGGALRPDLVMASGQGSWLTDTHGMRYLDFVGGWAVTALGHCPPEIVRAMTEQASTLIHCSPGYWNLPAMKLALKLKELTGMDRVFLGSTGAEANECAIKLARLYGAKKRGGAHVILTAQEGFHGRTLATMAATGKVAWRGLFGPDLTGFVHLPYGDLDAFEAAIGPDTCAIMLEPIQGEAGIKPGTAQFLTGLRLLCDRHGILLILDEVQTGMGRTGSWTRAQGLGIEPDILTLGKGLGAGYPISACLCREAWNLFQPGDQGGTFTYHPFGSAVALAVLATMEAQNLLAKAKQGEARLREILKPLEARYGLHNVRGAGMLLAFDLPSPEAGNLVQIARGHGLLLNAPRAATIRLMPALNLDAADFSEFAKRLECSVHALANSMH